MFLVSPCELHCTPKGLFGLYFSKKLADQVRDGTPCFPGKRDVCINGKCEVCKRTKSSPRSDHLVISLYNSNTSKGDEKNANTTNEKLSVLPSNSQS